MQMTVDLPLRAPNVDRYTPYDRIALTAAVEDGEDLDKVYTNLQLEIQRLYHEKKVPDDAYKQTMHHEETIQQSQVVERPQPRKPAF
jgi:hypothetical protein